MSNEITKQPGVYNTCSNRVTISLIEDASFMTCFRDRVVMDLTPQGYGRLRSTCKLFYLGLDKEGFKDKILLSIKDRCIQYDTIIKDNTFVLLEGRQYGGFCEIHFDDTIMAFSISQELYEPTKKLLCNEVKQTLLDSAINRMARSYVKILSNLTIDCLLTISSNRNSCLAIIKQLLNADGTILHKAFFH